MSRTKQSISVKLLRSVFAVYCLVAVGVTLVQMLIEYNGMEDTIRSRLVQYQSNLQNSLSEDIWHLDITKIGSSIDGIVLAPEVIGANVLSPDGYFIARAGVVPTIERNRQSLQFGHYQSPQLEYSGELIEHSFKLVADQADKEHLATVVLLSLIHI